MTFEDVSNFLGEEPLSRKKATIWNTFEKVFQLHWGSNIKKRSGGNQKYRQGLLKVLDLLVEIDDDGDSPESLTRRFKEMLRTSVEYYFTCLPATCPATWIAPNGSHDTATWLAFLRDGTQDGSATSPDKILNEDNSWARIRMSIKRDRMFGLSARNVVELEMIEQLKAQRRARRFQSYDGSQRDLVFYQDDESVRISEAEIRKTRKDRRRRHERKKAELHGRILSYKRIERANRLENERRIAEKDSEERERWIHIQERAREREEREKRVRKQENYRIVKRCFTPSQVFQRKYPDGRPPKHPRSEDDDDPLCYHNLRKAAKRGRWD